MDDNNTNKNQKLITIRDVRATVFTNKAGEKKYKTVKFSKIFLDKETGKKEFTEVFSVEDMLKINQLSQRIIQDDVIKEYNK